MKKMIFLVFILVSSIGIASQCLINLEKIVREVPDLKVVDVQNYYDCSESACALTFENDNYPYSNFVMLAFLDIKNKIKVVHAIVRNDKAYGWDNFNKRKISYLQATFQNESLAIKASIETPRDAIFWPPHRVYFKETLSCSLK